MQSLLCTMLTGLILVYPAGTMAEGRARGGDEFRKTAEDYENKSAIFEEKGLHELAGLYKRQAAIKREAAAKGDEGRWQEIDWREYQDNEGRINALIHKNSKTYKKYR